jgi:hypothetical protein
VSRPISSFYKDEFEAFKETLTSTWGIDLTAIRAVEADLRGIYRKYLGIASMGAIVSHRARRNDYCRGVAEVSYLSMILSMKGLENSASVLLRQSVELTLKHIYFSTHPVEFSWSLTREGYKEITFQFLLDYLKKTDEASIFPQFPELIQQLEGRFHILSRYVHVHSRDFIPNLGFRRPKFALANTLDALIEHANDLWPTLTSLFITFCPNRYIAASHSEKKVVTATLGRKHADRVKRYLMDLSLRSLPD